MKFLLTYCGAKKIKQIYLEKSKALLKVVMGDRYQAIDENRTALASERIKLTPDLLSSAEDSEFNLHLQIYLEKTLENLAIHEIGLLIADSNRPELFTLLAICGSQQPLLRTASNSDLVMDIIIDLKSYSNDLFINESYQPKFSMPYANYDTYGLVRFANSDEIKNRAKGLALSTNHLEILFSKKNKVFTWTKVLTNCIEFEVGVTKIVSQRVIYVDGYIYQIYVANHGEEANYILKKYNLKENKIKEEVFGDGSFINKIQVNNAPAIDGYLTFGSDKKLEYIFFSPLLEPYKLNITTNQLVKSKIGLLHLGSLFSYNGYLGSIGGYKSASKTLSLVDKVFFQDNEGKAIQSDHFLKFKRDKPIVHIVLDKLYCIGGCISKDDPLIEIFSFYLKDKEIIKSFFYVPESFYPKELEVNARFTTCLHESWIYIFMLDGYYDKSHRERNFFYRYHTISQQWQTLVFPKEALVECKSGALKLKYSAAVSTSEGIFLFLTQNIGEKINKFELTILKYVP